MPALRAESQVYLAPFYVNTTRLNPGGQPLGKVLASEPAVSTVPGSKAWRIAYVSSDGADRRTVVTALIAVPDAPAPAGGRKLLAWAHGTTGTARRCGPSQMEQPAQPLNQYMLPSGTSYSDFGLPAMKELISQGYVIVATDYQGLGGPGDHQYAQNVSNGRDVINALRAARDFAPAQAGKNAIVYGWSQGGGATIGAAGQGAYAKASDGVAPVDILGFVAMAPQDAGIQIPGGITTEAEAGRLIEALNNQFSSNVFNFTHLVMMYWGLAAADPGLKISDLLTPQATSQINAIMQRKCIHELSASFSYTYANGYKQMLKDTPGTADVRITATPGRPELHVDIDRVVASDRGLPAGLVGATARFFVEGEIAGALRDGGKEADIRVRADRRFVDSPEDIANLPLPSPRGLATLGEVAKIGMKAGPSEITHFNRMRSVVVTTQVANGAALGDVLTGFQTRLAAAPLSEGHYLTIDGQARDMEETGKAMGMAIGIAALFVFMVLASQFESLLHPFTLMVSVPLAFVGAIGGLWVTGKSISMGSQIGIILLMGLVTKNAILLLDGALQSMREGANPVEAIRLAGPRRLRPILMTSAAMALGMIPTAIGTGIGAEFRAPMAIAVIGGVLSSTVLTLLVVPVAFLWVEKARDVVAARLWGGGGPPAAGELGPRAVGAPTHADAVSEPATERTETLTL